MFEYLSFCIEILWTLVPSYILLRFVLNIILKNRHEIVSPTLLGHSKIRISMKIFLRRAYLVISPPSPLGAARVICRSCTCGFRSRS
jgi:hypothetical protein